MSSPNINSNYFDGRYKEIWRSLIPEALTKAETDYLVQEANLTSGKKVLDLMCGYGRNAIGLAEKGIEVTAVDNLKDYINEIREIVKERHLPITPVASDILDWEVAANYDLVICLGNNLNFFKEDELNRIFEKVSAALKPRSKFIFSTWSITEIVVKQFQEKLWSYVGKTKFLYEGKFLFNPARVEFETIFIEPDGQTETKHGVDYVYSVNELTSMLGEHQLVVKEIYSIPGRKKFTVGEPRAYFVVEKIG